MNLFALRKSHPQMFCLKMICTSLYYLGIGNCWHERVTSRHVKHLYTLWFTVSNVYIFGGVFNELLAFFRVDLTVKEKNDLVQFALGHSTVLAKITVLYLQRNRIKNLFAKFWEGDQWFTSLELENMSVKRAQKYSAAICMTAFMTLCAIFTDAITSHYRQGVPMRVEVTFFPVSRTDLFSEIIRIAMDFHMWFIIVVMLFVDCMSICCLVFTGVKFMMVQLYFEKMRDSFLENTNEKSRQDLEKEFLKKFVIGIKLHENTLWCASYVQYALGNLYSIQVVESIILIVMCLIKLVSGERNLTFLVANLIFIGCLIVLTGVYMMAGGDITSEAAMVPYSIFYSGWELNRASKELRTLAVVALLRSQVPVLMTAFGIMSLSYTNFIYVIRHSYSFFAVMY